MKIKALMIIILLIFTSISIAEASSIYSSDKKQVNAEGNDGRIYGSVESQGHSMPIGVPNLKVACGTSLKNYEIKVTNEDGYFSFPDLTYENTGTKYYIWIPPGQKVFFRGIKTVELNDENPDEVVFFFVLLKFLASRNNVINNFIYQLVKNLLDFTPRKTILLCRNCYINEFYQIFFVNKYAKYNSLSSRKIT